MYIFSPFDPKYTSCEKVNIDHLLCPKIRSTQTCHDLVVWKSTHTQHFKPCWSMVKLWIMNSDQHTSITALLHLVCDITKFWPFTQSIHCTKRLLLISVVFQRLILFVQFTRFSLEVALVVTPAPPKLYSWL